MPDLRRKRVGSNAALAEQLFAWRAEHARAMRQRAGLDEYINKLARMIESASKLVTSPPSERGMISHFDVRRRARGKVLGSGAPQMKPGSWTEAVYQVVVVADRLITMDELRDELAKTRKVENGWISGVQRLKDSGHIVSYKRRIGTPAVRQRVLDDIATGRTPDLEALSFRSVWGKLICALLERATRDVTANEIAHELRKNPEFAEKLVRNPYRVYQVLRSLVNSNKVVKRRTFYRLAGKQFEVTASTGAGPADTMAEQPFRRERMPAMTTAAPRTS
jgi:hypothetical protein